MHWGQAAWRAAKSISKQMNCVKKGKWEIGSSCPEGQWQTVHKKMHFSATSHLTYGQHHRKLAVFWRLPKSVLTHLWIMTYIWFMNTVQGDTKKTSTFFVGEIFIPFWILASSCQTMLTNLIWRKVNNEQLFMESSNICLKFTPWHCILREVHT